MSELQLEDLATLCAIPRSPSGPFGGNSRRCPSIVVHHSSLRAALFWYFLLECLYEVTWAYD